jgi:hypothetical protein
MLTVSNNESCAVMFWSWSALAFITWVPFDLSSGMDITMEYTVPVDVLLLVPY